MPHFLLGSEQMRCPCTPVSPASLGLWGLGERNAILLSALPEAGVKGMDEVWVRCLWGEPWLVDLQVSWSVRGRGDHGGTPVPHSSSYLARLQ